MQTFKQPNIKGPRFRPKTKHVVDRHFVTRFREKYPQYAHMTREDILRIVRAFNEKIKQEIFNSNVGVELPHHLGCIFIGSCTADVSANYNFKESAKHNQPLRYTNLATDGMIAKIFYCNSHTRYRLPLRELWCFAANKEFRKQTSEAFKENFERYTVIDNKKQIAHIFRKERLLRQEYAKSKENLTDYKEFDI